ncbi:MAG: hypothetical protein AAF846_30245, partial [Chloroflexota bacterium]
GVIVMVVTCLATLSVPCVNNFYNRLPVYPDATLSNTQASRFNYIGFGELQLTYSSPESLDTIQAWYQEIVDDVLNEARRAQILGEDAPPTWNHRYELSEANNGEGTEIVLTAQCLN